MEGRTWREGRGSKNKLKTTIRDACRVGSNESCVSKLATAGLEALQSIEIGEESKALENRGCLG